MRFPRHLRAGRESGDAKPQCYPWLIPKFEETRLSYACFFVVADSHRRFETCSHEIPGVDGSSQGCLLLFAFRGECKKFRVKFSRMNELSHASRLAVAGIDPSRLAECAREIALTGTQLAALGWTPAT